jgi:hypothetical protein
MYLNQILILQYAVSRFTPDTSGFSWERLGIMK